MAKKSKKIKDKQRAKYKAKIKEKQIKEEGILYICTECGVEEYIPRDVVEMFDEIDDENIIEPPTFSCEKCGAIMRPKKYEGVHGITYEF
ncbi:putative RNA-binding Zn-ribbon protein involved in translation (DUF1610 family) [Clostridium algifaecis]|uniref:RNA-binding Zn-ribbon protein involved in translation (DUF1610 family) n=1 Tax=Clostridium algifaecis TaxID=1472040 RepID=A0ABS4KXL1_9CLOT|nr:hypothetical protein [Clostridium algifaecis]MBP2034211.1 putative RNA-binding Zn-ribbon protein involved in translation (DUF1610 family) [Clostridium algifaecis]